MAAYTHDMAAYAQGSQPQHQSNHLGQMHSDALVIIEYLQAMQKTSTDDLNEIKGLIQSLASSTERSMNLEHTEPPVRQESFKSIEKESSILQYLHDILLRVFPGEGRRITSDALGECERLLEHLKAQVDKYKSQNDVLNAELIELRSSSERIAILSQRLQESEALHRKAREQNAKFRSMITRGARTDSEPIDSDIKSRIGEIRARIESIVTQHYGVTPKRASPDELQKAAPEVWRKQRGLFDTWKSQNTSEASRRYDIRAAVYDILATFILNQPCFGLDRKADYQMSIFENELRERIKDHPEQLSEVLEWRRQTILCVEHGGIQYTAARFAANIIFDFLLPLLPKRSQTPGVNGDLPNDLVYQLCRQALELALTLRKSKSMYSFETIKPGTRCPGYEQEDFVPQYFVDGRSDELCRSEVSLTLFGSLVRYPDPCRLTERDVVEKAWVILQLERPQ